ncbi:fumarate reductase subunit FrdD, partial [Psychromonas arctica]|uniref:fumarate reductase subunit FrdD n=1 Tax=Psychromonas arctica TaxID=168275 RepID=UPI003CC97CEA
MRSNEPVFWGLFVAGGMITAFLTPVMVLVTGLLITLGIIDADHLSYDKFHEFASSWNRAAIILVLVA